MRRVSRQFGRVQYSAVEYHFHDPRIRVDRLRRILSKQQQIGTSSDLHGADVPIQFQLRSRKLRATSELRNKVERERQ